MASDLGLHGLLMSHKKDALSIMVNRKFLIYLGINTIKYCTVYNSNTLCFSNFSSQGLTYVDVLHA